MFSATQLTPRFGARAQAGALETWRDAERLVGLRWRAFVDAEPADRSSAFASYVEALDAEEAAATDMATLAA
jgi:hypothetical protein